MVAAAFRVGLRVGDVQLIVDALAASYEYCRTAGCAITSEPTDEAWGGQ